MIIKELMLSAQVAPTFWRGEIPYFSKSDAILLLEVCGSLDVGVLGIEGFVVHDSSIQPQMDWVADFSEVYKSNGNSKFVEETIKYSMEFLSMPMARDDIFFEFVLKR